MAYQPQIPAGVEVPGVNLPLDAEGGLGYLSALYQEQMASNRMMAESTISMMVLNDIKDLLSDIATSLKVLANKP